MCDQKNVKPMVLKWADNYHGVCKYFVYLSVNIFFKKIEKVSKGNLPQKSYILILENLSLFKTQLCIWHKK